MVALQTLTLPVGVRIPIPQPTNNPPLWAGCLFTEMGSNSEGSKAEQKSNAPVERLPSRNERREAIKIPIPQPEHQSARQGGLIVFSL